MIKINSVIKKYKNNVVLDINSFIFEKNKSYIIVGENGSGKSTLIKCILGINSINKGEIVVDTRNIGYVPEKYYFPDFCTINDFLVNILKLYDKIENNYLIDYYCILFNIDKYIYLSKLSKGMLQKVLIIQSLIHDAELYIFDEPLNGLDDHSQKIFFDIIKKIKKDKTIIITTHYPKFYFQKYDYNLRINNRGIFYENS